MLKSSLAYYKTIKMLYFALAITVLLPDILSPFSASSCDYSVSASSYTPAISG